MTTTTEKLAEALRLARKFMWIGGAVVEECRQVDAALAAWEAKPEPAEPVYVSQQQALEAIDALDDLARMTVGVDAHGPRRVLERFVAAATPAATAPADLARDYARALDAVKGHVARIEALEQEAREHRAFRNMVSRHSPEFPADPSPASRDVWYWQGDGSDNLDSMAHQLPVVIRAEQLRALAAAGHAQKPLEAMNAAWLEVGADVAGLSWEQFAAAYARACAQGITGDSNDSV